jgi:hypothetical protein
MFWKILCWKCQILSSLIENLLSTVKNRSVVPHPTTGYLDSRCYPELRSYLRHTEWQVGISLTFFFHFIYFLDFKFSDKIAAIVIIGIHCGQNNTSFLSRSYKFNKNIQKSCLLNCLFKGALERIICILSLINCKPAWFFVRN